MREYLELRQHPDPVDAESSFSGNPVQVGIILFESVKLFHIAFREKKIVVSGGMMVIRISLYNRPLFVKFAVIQHKPFLAFIPKKCLYVQLEVPTGLVVQII